jgi:CDP-glycerol glycerophosphotransferase (TagB/SpsB family)
MMLFITKIYRRIKYYIFYTLMLFFRNFISKSHNVWVFGAWYGKHYSDNSKYLFRYLNRKNTDLKLIWIGDDKEVIKEVINDGGEACWMLSLKSLYWVLKAKVYVYSTSPSDICLYDSKNTIFVNVWHGMPMKKICCDHQKPIKKKVNFLQIINRFILFKIIHQKVPEPHLIPATSKFTAKFLKSAFRTKNVYILGQPRDDVFFIKNRNHFKSYLGYNISNKTIVTYLPTHRKYGFDQTKKLFSSNEMEQEAEEIFLANNIIFFEKRHFSDKQSPRLSNLTSIIDISEKNIDVQELLCISDVLITDYSSCFVDFILTKRPIIFYPYDLNDYIINDNDLYFDYKSNVPGPIVYNEKELLSTIVKFTHDSAIYNKMYNIKADKFQLFSDGRNCERVADAIWTLLCNAHD